MPRLAAFLLGAVLAAAAAQPLAQERPLDPLDEAAKDASWVAFKKRLLTAVQKRDRQFLLGIIDPEVRSGIDTSRRGIAEFGRQWQLDSEASPLWQELAAALALPAAYHRPERGPVELCVPYVAVRWPQDIDAFSHGAITAARVPVRSAPSAGAATLATLSYNIVPVTSWETDDQKAGVGQKWVKIRLKGGEGYVPEELIRSPIEHTACFVKGDKGWRLIGFGPGGGK